MVSREALITAWLELIEHDRRFEVPDVIGHADGHARLLAGAAGGEGATARAGRFPIPKRSGGMRWLDLLGPSDHARYRALVAVMAARIDARLGPGVASDRLRAGANGTSGRPGSLPLQRWRAARRRYERLLRRLLASRPGAVLIGDVRDCFGSIRPRIVEAALVPMGISPVEARAVAGLLRRLRRQGVSGLPVGPEPSGVLANAVLAQVDVALAEEGGAVIRWVDDVVVWARGFAHAERLQERFREELDRVGLAAAEEKCAVVDPAAVAVASGRAVPSGLASGARSAPRAADPFAELEGAASDAGALARLGALRSVATRRWGSAEAAVLLAVAEDRRQHPSERAWAWLAVARSDPRQLGDKAAALADEDDPAVRRAIVSRADVMGRRRARRFLLGTASRDRELAATAAWAMAR